MRVTSASIWASRVDVTTRLPLVLLHATCKRTAVFLTKKIITSIFHDIHFPRRGVINIAWFLHT